MRIVGDSCMDLGILGNMMNREQGILGVNDDTSALALSGYCTIF